QRVFRQGIERGVGAQKIDDFKLLDLHGSNTTEVGGGEAERDGPGQSGRGAAHQRLGSDINPFTIASVAASNTIANGNPVDTAMAGRATSPPPRISAMAARPAKMAQNTRGGRGASTLPPADITSMTNDPESDEVTKNTTTSTMARNEV